MMILEAYMKMNPHNNFSTELNWVHRLPRDMPSNEGVMSIDP